MQIQTATPHAGKTALRSGASIGIVLGIIHSAIVIISTMQSAPASKAINASTTLLYLITPLIWIVGLLIAGAWGSKVTGRIGTGTLAGLFAGLFGGIVAGFGQAIATTISVNLSATTTSDANLFLFGGVAAILYILVLAIGVGTGLGALGGLIGQTISDVRPQPAPPVHQPSATPYGYASPQNAPQPQQPPRPQFPEQ